MAAIRYPFTIYVVDTSVLARRHLPDVAAALAHAQNTGELGTCSLLIAEVCYSARDRVSYQQLRDMMEAMILLNSDDRIEEMALAAQRSLAEAGEHRTSIVDLFVAAIAAAHDAIVLHYDGDYERLGKVLGARTQWVVPRGSI